MYMLQYPELLLKSMKILIVLQKFLMKIQKERDGLQRLKCQTLANLIPMILWMKKHTRNFLSLPNVDVKRIDIVDEVALYQSVRRVGINLKIIL